MKIVVLSFHKFVLSYNDFPIKCFEYLMETLGYNLQLGLKFSGFMTPSFLTT